MSNWIKNILFLTAVCLGFNFVIAQSSAVPFHYRIGEKDFANVDVYSILFDEEEEVLYAGTDNGVFYFAQSRFHKIPCTDKAKGNSFFELKKDVQGNIYCKNLNGQIFRVDKSKVELFIEVPSILSRGNFTYIVNREGDVVCLGTKMIEYQIENSQVVDTAVLLEESGNLWCIIQNENSNYILGAVYNQYERMKEELEDNPNFEVLDGRNIFALRNRILSFKSGNVGRNNGAYIVHDDFLQVLDSGGTSFDQDFYLQMSDSSVAVLDRQAGMNMVYFNKEDEIQTKSLFESEFISVAHQNQKGVLFLGTFKEGIIVVPSIDFIGSQSNSLLTSIRNYDDEFYVVSKREGIVEGYNISGSEGTTLAQVNINLDKVFIHEKRIASTKDWNRLFVPVGLPGKEWCTLGSKGMAALNWRGIIMFDLEQVRKVDNSICANWHEYNAKLINVNHRSSSFTADTVNRIIYSSESGGLFKMDYLGNDKTLITSIQEAGLSDLYFNNGLLYCGTFDGRIIILKDDSYVDEINLRKTESNTTVKRILIKGDRLFALTGSGLQVYNLKQKEFESYGLASNLMDESVVDFDISQDHILILRKKDHFSIPIKLLSQDSEPSKVYVDSCLVNRQMISFEQTQFKHNQNSFQFFIDYRDFSTRLRHRILYKLEGLFSEWKELKDGSHEIEFLSLPPGSYTLTTKAVFEGNDSELFTYSFTIHPPFWQRWWFYLLVIIATAVTIGLISNYRLRQIRLKASQKIQIETNQRIAINAQLKAIRAQMNPHFIFNAINSIQDLVLQQETLKSYDYLASFSKLVRMTLNHSEREFVTLQEEIDFLKLYLDLESLRFDNSFEFELEIKTSNTNHVIPSLIIQPFVENAIKHGLLHKKGEKSLRIKFLTDSADSLKCVVMDNGVGRQKSKKIMDRRGSEHSSFSTNAIKRRMEMLGSQLGEKCEYITEDLLNDEGASMGTKIIITLPIIRSSTDNNS